MAAELFDAHVSTQPISAPMVAALESAWSAIRDRHPELPAVVVVLGAGSIGQAGRLRLGTSRRCAGNPTPPSTPAGR